MPRISVVMTAYNTEKYIDAAIQSILNQTYTDFEFIIVNDGSTDLTAKIVRKYTDPRIRFIDNKQNKGISDAANQGLAICTGEYIARMDSDDIALPTRFEKQIAYMDAHPECGVLGTACQVFGKSNDVMTLPERPKILNLLSGCAVANPTAMIRKSVMDKYDFKYNPEYNFAEDYELWSRMVFVTQIHNTPEILLKYRWSGSNVSITHKQRQHDLAKRVQQNMLQRLTDDNITQQIIREISTHKIGILLPKWLGRICCLFIPNRNRRHEFRRKYVK